MTASQSNRMPPVHPNKQFRPVFGEFYIRQKSADNKSTRSKEAHMTGLRELAKLKTLLTAKPGP